MKNILIICLLLLVGAETIDAQNKSKWPSLDKSPMDMIQYPDGVAWRNYLSGSDRNLSPKIKVLYSRPMKNDRDIFGSLVPYGKEWRLGANQATEVIFYQAVQVGDVMVPRGAYTMFATPEANAWTISFSSQRNIWGSKNRDLSKTVATIKFPTEKTQDMLESLSMVFQKVDEDNVNLVIGWDMTQVKVPINFNPIVYSGPDTSPMDQAIYPGSADGLNYIDADKLAGSQAKIKVLYGRPQMKDRKIFGELLKYGEVWRVGANESTVVNFYSDVTVAGTDIKSGAYNLYAVVNEKSWDLIFNTDMPAWGSANREESKDVAKITVPVTTEKETLDALGIMFKKKSDNEVNMIIGWENTRCAVPIMFKK